MSRRALLVTFMLATLAVVAAACSSGSKTPAASPTPAQPGPIDAIREWVRQNRNVDFVGDCRDAKQGADVGKLCASETGSRGTRKAFALGPTFSDPTALALLEQAPEGWKILSVKNRDPSKGNVPGIDWPLQVGDQVIVIGLGEGDCLNMREQPSQAAKAVTCLIDGTKAIVQEGPTDADTFTWWRISVEGFTGWAAGAWLRLPDAIAAALNPPTPAPTSAQ